MKLPFIDAKVKYFVDRGFDLRGVIHIGASDGEEFPYYLYRCSHVIGFEPLPLAFQECVDNFSDEIYQKRVKVFNVGIGMVEGKRSMYMETAPEGRSTGRTGGSTMLEEDHKPLIERGYTIEAVDVEVRRFDSFCKDHPEIDLSLYNCLVIDAQGMELEVLMSMGDLVKKFQLFNIECSEKPIYGGGVAAQEVIDYLAGFGIVQQTPIFDHDDIMFFNTMPV